jgi:hypothetical protein
MLTMAPKPVCSPVWRGSLCYYYYYYFINIVSCHKGNVHFHSGRKLKLAAGRETPN